jgi:hypothetical protein
MIKKSKHHPNSVNVNNFKHMLIAFKVSYNMFYGSLLSVIHGLPGLFQNCASNKIKELYEFINKKKIIITII